MADMNKFLSLAGLTHYDTKLKSFIANADLVVMNKVSEAQAEIDALEKLVGTLPEGTTAGDVVAYVDLKTQGIASEAVLSQLQETVSAIDEAVKAIEADYLKAITAEADRAKGEEKKNADAIVAEKERAEGIEGDHETRIAAIEADYLVEADKTELSNAINAEKERAMAAEKVNSDAIAVLNGTGEGSVTTTVDDAINKFATDVTNDDVVNSYKELIDWVATHGSEAAEMAAAIEANEASISDLEKLVGSLPEGETSENIVAYIQKLVAAEETRATGVESGFETRIKNLEDTVGTTADGKTVAEQISEAVADVQADVNELEEVVNTKADSSTVTTLSEKVDGIDGEVDQLQTDLEAAEEALATKAAASDVTALQGDMTTAKADIAQLKTDVDAVEEAVATKASQDDLTAATGRITTAEGEIDTLQTEMDAVETKASANETAISTLSSIHATDKAALEASISDNADAIQALEDSLVEITTDEIDALFATTTA